MSSHPITTTNNTFSPLNSNSSTTAGAAVDDASPISKAMSDDELEATPNSRSPSPAPPSPPTNERDLALVPANPPPTAARTPVFPAREDCWSEAATHTLIKAWGSHYMELNRGNLRRQHWMEVAEAVNTEHGHTKKQYRTDIQCKNRIDTLKKKYKTERARVSQSRNYVSSWPFFKSLDALIGNNFKPSPSPATITPQRKTPPVLPPPPSAVPVGPRSKRPAAVDETVSRRNFSAMAAAAAAATTDDSEENEESETSTPPPAPAFSGGSKRRDLQANSAQLEGFRCLADAIVKFGEIYKRVEQAKLRQMVELEKQRMQFAKDLELQRMKLIMESQVQLQKLKRVKRNSHPPDNYFLS